MSTCNRHALVTESNLNSNIEFERRTKGNPINVLLCSKLEYTCQIQIAPPFRSHNHGVNLDLIF